MIDKRNAARQKSLLRGFVYFGSSPSAFECVVHDISETGARLKFQNPPPTIDTLELHIPIKGQTIRAKVRWHESDEIGIVFMNASNPISAQPTEGELIARVSRLEAEITVLKHLVKRLQQNTASKIEAA